MSASCYPSHTAQDSYILLPEPNKSKRNTDFHGESEAMQILPLYLDGDLVEGRESNDAEAEETWFAGSADGDTNCKKLTLLMLMFHF